VFVTGLTLSIIGITVVFVFLVLLIAIMQTLSAVITKFFPEPAEGETATAKKDDAEIAAAIAAAAALTKS